MRSIATGALFLLHSPASSGHGFGTRPAATGNGRVPREFLMSITNQRKQEVIGEYRRSDADSGSPEVQVAILTDRIKSLTGHLKTHKHDFASRRGLLLMVSRRNRLLKYLARADRGRYQQLIGRLGLRK